MAGLYRVRTPGGGSVVCYPVAGGSWQSTCDTCGPYFAKGTQEQVEAKAKQHLATRWRCANPNA